MDVNANITIEPGVVIQFKENAGIVVRSGYFRALGTAQKPVVLKGEMNLPGFWKGIYYQNSSLLNELLHTHISNAGGTAFDSNADRGSIILFGPGRVKMDSCRIERSGHFGVNVPYDNCDFEITNTVFANNARSPFNILAPYMGKIDPSNIFDNSNDNFIGVVLSFSAITSDQLIKALPIPYRIYTTSAFQEWLYIDGGITSTQGPVVFQISDGIGINVSPNAGLRVEGSENNKVIFTGINPQPGSWKGIYFNATQQDNRLIHTVVEYAGTLYEGNRSAIWMWASPRLRIENSIIRNTNGCAIYDFNGQDNPNLNLTQTNNSFINNSGGEVCFP
jgi:hypothetical protein